MSSSTCQRCHELIPPKAHRCPICGTCIGEQPADAVLEQAHHAGGTTQPTTSAESISMMVTDESPAAESRRLRGPWMMVVLLSCILFSGLAVLLSMQISERMPESGIIFQPPSKKQKADPPRWTLTVPHPRDSGQQDPPIVAQHENDPQPGKSDPNEVKPQPSPNPAVAEVKFSAQDPVLGPQACAAAPAPVAAPTREQADQALFLGQFERAATIYESLLRESGRPDLQMLQDLALCYQQLGDSKKAAEHLDQALQGYQAILNDDPQNAAALQAANKCKASLHSLALHHDPAP